MSKRSDSLLADFFSNKWSATNAPAAGATIVAATPTPVSNTHRHILETLSYSITNMNAGSGHTVTIQVREASVSGTVLWSRTHLVNGSTTVNVDAAPNLAAQRGKTLHFMNNTVLASVVATLNAAGWTDTGSSY